MKDKKRTYQGNQNTDSSRVHNSTFVIPGVGNGGVVMSPIYRTHSFMEWAPPEGLLMLNVPANAMMACDSTHNHQQMQL